MRNFVTIIENPYEDDRITLTRMSYFAVYLKNQLTANNPGNVYDTYITSLDDAILPTQPAVNGKDLAITNQKGMTIGLNILTDQFETTVHDNYHIIAGVFKPGTPTFNSFFPNGLSEYNKIGRKDAPTLMNRMKTATNNHSLQLPAAVVTAFASFPAQWDSMRPVQQSAISDTDDHGETLQLLKKVLADVCWKATGAVISQNGSNTDLIAGYFDASLLFPPTAAKQAEEAPKEKV